MHTHNDTIIYERRHFFRKIYLSLYLKGFERVTQCFTVRGSWRPNRTATYWYPHSYGHQPFFPILQSCSTGGPGAQLSAGCWLLSLPHLVSKLSGLQNWSGLQKIFDLQTAQSGSRGPLLPGADFLYHILSPTLWLLVFTELYNISIAHSISPNNWPSECVTSAVFRMACLIVI